MNRKFLAAASLANVIAVVALAVSIHGDVHAVRADQHTDSVQREAQLETQMDREHQNVNNLAADARKFDIYRAGQNVHVENRSDGAVRHIYITWSAVGSGRPVVQEFPDLPKCYEYVIPAQGKANLQHDVVPDIYWTDLTGMPWTRDDGLLVNPVSSHSADVETPDQPSGATFENLTARHLNDC